MPWRQRASLSGRARACAASKPPPPPAHRPRRRRLLRSTCPASPWARGRACAGSSSRPPWRPRSTCQASPSAPRQRSPRSRKSRRSVGLEDTPEWRSKILMILRSTAWPVKPLEVRFCAACGKLLRKAAFSGTQWRSSRNRRRCDVCANSGRPRVAWPHLQQMEANATVKNKYKF